MMSDQLEEILAKIPPETRWAIAAKALTGAFTGLLNILRDIVGHEKALEIIQQFWAEAGKGTKELVAGFGVTGDDCKTTSVAIPLSAILTMGPEFELEIAEATQDRAVIKITKCPWWERAKELGIKHDLCTWGDQAYSESAVKTFNPKLSVAITKSMPRGDPYCEVVQELKR